MNDTTTTPNLRERARQAMHRLKLSSGDLGSELEIPRRALVRWLGDKGVSSRDIEEVEPKVEAWLGPIEQVDTIVAGANAHGADDYLATPTSERITSALAYVKAQGDMAAIFGAPGVGKTTAARYFSSMYPNVWTATITPATSAVVPALEEISEAVGLRGANAGARSLTRAIQARVRDVHGCLIIDEAQHLSTSAVEEVRAIHDATGVGIALMGNELSYARLRGAHSARFAQIYSRLGLRLHVPAPGPRDVRAIADRWRARDAKVLELLERVGSRPGGLRSVTKVLRIATLAGAHAPTFERVRAACLNLGVEE